MGHAARRGSIKRTCQICGIVFPITPSRANTNCACSRACAAVVRSRLKVAVNTQHGHAGNARIGRQPSPEYRVWTSMIARCTNPRVKKYEIYGGAGITVCERWRHSFAKFFADMGPRPPQTSIDRIDGTKGYSPDNCRWADIFTQNRNRRCVRPELRP